MIFLSAAAVVARRLRDRDAAGVRLQGSGPDADRALQYSRHLPRLGPQAPRLGPQAPRLLHQALELRISVNYQLPSLLVQYSYHMCYSKLYLLDAI